MHTTRIISIAVSVPNGVKHELRHDIPVADGRCHDLADQLWPTCHKMAVKHIHTSYRRTAGPLANGHSIAFATMDHIRLLSRLCGLPVLDARRIKTRAQQSVPIHGFEFFIGLRHSNTHVRRDLHGRQSHRLDHSNCWTNHSQPRLKLLKTTPQRRQDDPL